MAEEWTVAGQGQGQVLGPTGALLDSWDVTFKTVPEGIQATVRIPLAEYMADPTGSVTALVQPLVDAIKQTQAL